MLHHEPVCHAKQFPGEIRHVDARELLTPSRLDLVVKYLYFRSVAGRPDSAAAELYDQHIARRTGGFEDDKRTLADYRAAAGRLLEAIERRGFDPGHAVPLGSNELPWDGAHRVAASLALNVPLAVRDVPGQAPAWDFEWFQTRGFTREQLDMITRTYAGLSGRVAAFVFWGPSRPHWRAMMARLQTGAQIVGWRDIDLDPADLRSFVHDLYAYRLGPASNDRIEAKAHALAADRPGLRVVLVEVAGSTAATAASWTVSAKADLRAISGRDAGDYFATVHATDSVNEARYVANAAFNDNSLRQLATRRGCECRPGFVAWLAAYRRILHDQNIAIEDACIVGSAVLEAVGLREATDIDCVIATDVRSTRFQGGVVKLGSDVDLVTAGYHRRHDGGPVVDDTGLVNDPRQHFMFRGLKFANPELVIDRKRQHGRPKDLMDVALWDARHTTAPWATVGQPVAVVWGNPVRVASHLTQGTGHSIELPPEVDLLPGCVLTDPDPLATLNRLNVHTPKLHDIESRASGTPAHAGHAFKRLLGFAWVARWIEQWISELQPAVMVIPAREHDTYSCLAGSIATSLGIRVAGRLEDAAADLGADPSAARPHHGDVRDVCRRATELTRLARRAKAADLAEADALSVRSDAAVAVAERLATERRLASAEVAVRVLQAAAGRRAIWIRGAGAAGKAAVNWLNGLGVPVAGLIDADRSKHGLTFGAARIVAPGIVRDADWRSGSPLVLVASVHADEIVAELTSCGVDRSDILSVPAAITIAQTGR